MIVKKRCKFPIFLNYIPTNRKLLTKKPAFDIINCGEKDDYKL